MNDNPWSFDRLQDHLGLVQDMVAGYVYAAGHFMAHAEEMRKARELREHEAAIDVFVNEGGPDHDEVSYQARRGKFRFTSSRGQRTVANVDDGYATELLLRAAHGENITERARVYLQDLYDPNDPLPPEGASHDERDSNLP